MTFAIYLQGARFINLQVSSLVDKWYGESQKRAEAVFSLVCFVEYSIAAAVYAVYAVYVVYVVPIYTVVADFADQCFPKLV